MDVNGTRFHLIKGRADWERGHFEGLPAGDLGDLQVSAGVEELTLAERAVLFPRGRRDLPLEPEARRGAAVDAFGNWFWISQDETSIYWQHSGDGRVSVYWDQREPETPRPSSDFAACSPAPAVIERLAGLTVTEDHYLIVGSPSLNGLIIIDLYGGGPPLRLSFPEHDFAPFDMAPRSEGGAWILDRQHRRLWILSPDFRIITSDDLLVELEPERRPDFGPTDGEPTVFAGRSFPDGFLLDPDDPIAVEALPESRVLILGRPGGDGAGRIWQYHFGELEAGPIDLPDIGDVVDARGAGAPVPPVVGHDVAYDPEALELYVVERDGNQAIAFRYDWRDTAGGLEPLPRYLPMHRFGARALVHRAGELSYDISGSSPVTDPSTRWARLRAIEDARYAPNGVYLSPVFDGRERDCVWHRLFLDACIPQETAVRVWTRTHNEPGLVESAPFHAEPAPYLRDSGAEIPYWDPFAGDARFPESTGTWELLFQRAQGRYMQLRLELSGNGRRTPRIRALRAYYPRFSYPRQFLPNVFLEAGGPTSFLERMLANPEGIYTDLHNAIAHSAALFDPQGAPPEALDWLAGWLGLIVDPLWGQIHQVRRSRQCGTSAVHDRRRLFISFARKLFERRGTPGGIMFALLLLLEPDLEDKLRQIQLAAIGQADGMLEDLARLGLPAPQFSREEQHYEDLLHDYLLHPERQSSIRLVERYAAREGRAAVAGDPSGDTPAGESIAQSAHRFSVLIPESLSPEEESMVHRIVELEKPAHTLFDVRRYWDYFRVGEARLGIDTVLGEGSRWLPFLLGRDDLGAGYLAPAHPYDVPDRVIAARDRLSAMPAL